MPVCKQCSAAFPNKVFVDGKVRVLASRRYCLACSPFGEHNTRRLHVPKAAKKSAKFTRWQRKARKVRKAELVAMLGGCCALCGYSRCSHALDFHHRDRDQKQFGIALSLLVSRERLIEEAKKCILVCRNCHAEIHAGLHGALPEVGQVILPVVARIDRE